MRIGATARPYSAGAYLRWQELKELRTVIPQ